MLREQTGEHWKFIDGKYVGVMYRTPEQREADRKATDERARQEKWNETLSRVKVLNLDDLIRALGFGSYHKSAMKEMPAIGGSVEACNWIGETFGLTTYDDCEVITEPR